MRSRRVLSSDTLGATHQGDTMTTTHHMPVPGPPLHQQPPRADALAITGFVLAILLWPVGLGLCIAALVRARRQGLPSSGLAVAGVVIGAVGAAGTVLLGLMVAAGVAATTAQQDRAEVAGLRADVVSAAREVATVSVVGDPLSTAVERFAPQQGTALTLFVTEDAWDYCVDGASPSGHRAAYTAADGLVDATTCTELGFTQRVP